MILEQKKPTIVWSIRKSAPAVSLGVLVGLMVWALSFFDILGVLDGVVYDYMLLSTPHPGGVPPQVAIIQANAENRPAGDNSWLTLLEQVEKLHPKAVVFAFTPQGVSPRFYGEAHRYGNVLFGRRIETSPDNPDGEVLEKWPASAKDLKLPFGVIRLPVSEHGTFRTQQKRHLINHTWYPLLEAATAERARQEKSTPVSSAGSFRIDFSRGRDALPTLPLDRVLSSDLLPELIKDRVVLIGLSDLEKNVLYTPLSTDDTKLTPLQFHGYALETLLSGREILMTSGFWKLLCILAAIVLGFLEFPGAARPFSILLQITILSLYVLLTWCLLAFAQLWLPLTLLFLTHILSRIVFVHYRNRSEERQFQTMVLELSSKIKTHLIPERFYNTAEPWSKIITMVSQVMHLERCIFLECIKEKKVVREVAALGCNFDHIHERRRDYRRTPYTTAIEKNGLIKVDNYLKNGHVGEQQYLLPLIFLGNVQGFCAFSIKLETPMDAGIMAFVNDLGVEIAELLYHRESWFLEQRSHNFFSRYLSFQMGKRVSEDLGEMLSILERRITIVDDYLHSASIAAIVYDFFGRAIIVNRKMLSILEIEKLLLYDMTMLDLLQFLTEMSVDEVRHVLRSLLIGKDQLKIDITLPGHENNTYTLTLTALTATTQHLALEQGKLSSIEGRGFLCELEDSTEAKQAYTLKESMRERIDLQIKNDLTTLFFAAALLEKKSFEKDTHMHASDIFHHKSRSIIAHLEENNQLFSDSADKSIDEHYPLDGKKIITDAISTLEKKAIDKEVHIVSCFSDHTKLVYSSPQKIKWVLIQILEYLLNDAKTGSTLTIEESEKDYSVVFRFINVGFGMPNENFQSYLSDLSTSKASDTLKNIQKSIAFVRSWGGNLQGESEVGKGVTFTLTLRGYG